MSSTSRSTDEYPNGGVYDRNGDEVIHDVDGGSACEAIQN